MDEQKFKQLEDDFKVLKQRVDNLHRIIILMPGYQQASLQYYKKDLQYKKLIQELKIIQELRQGKQSE